MKTKEELTAVKEKAEAMNEKVRKLTDEELLHCSGGGPTSMEMPNNWCHDNFNPKNEGLPCGPGDTIVSDSTMASPPPTGRGCASTSV